MGKKKEIFPDRSLTLCFAGEEEGEGDGEGEGDYLPL
jgi:hypothetical protein